MAPALEIFYRPLLEYEKNKRDRAALCCINMMDCQVLDGLQGLSRYSPKIPSRSKKRRYLSSLPLSYLVNP